MYYVRFRCTNVRRILDTFQRIRKLKCFKCKFYWFLPRQSLSHTQTSNGNGPNQRSRNKKEFRFFFRSQFHEKNAHDSPDWISIEMSATNPVTSRSLCNFCSSFFRSFSLRRSCKLIITFCKSIFCSHIAGFVPAQKYCAH